MMYDRIQELLDRLNAGNRSLNKRIRRRNQEPVLHRLEKMRECIDELEELVQMEIEHQRMIKL
jgi:hypothetical protein